MRLLKNLRKQILRWRIRWALRGVCDHDWRTKVIRTPGRLWFVAECRVCGERR